MLKRGKKANSQERINIDYPKSAEAVFSPHYAVRITAAPCETVEVSVDGGPYAPAIIRLGTGGITLTASRKGHTNWPQG